jgi:hypothetical protein
MTERYSNSSIFGRLRSAGCVVALRRAVVVLYRIAVAVAAARGWLAA